MHTNCICSYGKEDDTSIDLCTHVYNYYEKYADKISLSVMIALPRVHPTESHDLFS